MFPSLVLTSLCSLITYLISSLYSLTPRLYPVPLIRYVLLVDMFLSRVQISSFSLLNLFPAYVLFCQLFRDLVNICTERPVGNQPVGISSLCQLKQPSVFVYIWETVSDCILMCVRFVCVFIAGVLWMRVRDEFKV